MKRFAILFVAVFVVLTSQVGLAAKDVAVPSELMEKAQRGDAGAMFDIANLYEDAAFSQDSNYQAMESLKHSSMVWMKQAADKGYAPAMSALAFAYFTGVGIPKNYKEGERLYLELVSKNRALDMAHLAFHYANGFGGRIDFAKSRKYANMAIAAGLDKNSESIQMVYSTIDDFNKASSGAKNGIIKDINKLSFLYYCADANQEAAKWAKVSAERGDAGGQSTLGEYYWEGNGVPKDVVLAYMWANLAAVSGKQGYIARRDAYRRSLTKEQIAEAERLARNWRPRR